MRRKRCRTRKKIITNKKKFILFLTLAIGSVFVLNYYIKEIFYKNKLSLGKNTSVYAESKLKKISSEKIEDESKSKKEKSEKDKKEELEKNKENIEQNTTKIEDNTEIDKKDADKKGIDKKDIDYKDIFYNDVFIGDSITDSLSFYGFIEEKNVIAKLGLTTVQGKEKIEEVKKVAPTNIYMLFGTNDILTGIDSEKFTHNYLQLIQLLKEKLPDVNIYVQSIFPISSNINKKKPLLTNDHIDEFNEALIKMCENENINYVDIASILKNEDNPFEPDGIHLKYNFYKLWLDYLVDNIKQ
ncbi:hypothetical protein KQI42_07160 [Tissierella sp. MSJ-40]|uniref:SGNH hydrolase-type esterase domain-containing protein n=1 Tax=Tissierella simiarum TaxID=2841534 RepID=A0ABS6E4D7_9FIRM|nr:GDSL-type esterase/lipase family protein [Tissierella simiarum]MBU5437780.1 hypothetical protein [Tissierella simiarum]